MPPVFATMAICPRWCGERCCLLIEPKLDPIAHHSMRSANNPLVGWTVDRGGIERVGRDLQRPECILAERDGTLWSADARGGVMRIRPDGTQSLITQSVDAHFDLAGDSTRS